MWFRWLSSAAERPHPAWLRAATLPQRTLGEGTPGDVRAGGDSGSGFPAPVPEAGPGEGVVWRQRHHPRRISYQ